MRQPKSDHGGRAMLVTHRNMVYVFCSMECSINFRSGKPRGVGADDEMYGCWQCGSNLTPDLGSMRSDGLARVAYNANRGTRKKRKRR